MTVTIRAEHNEHGGPTKRENEIEDRAKRRRDRGRLHEDKSDGARARVPGGEILELTLPPSPTSLPTILNSTPLEHHANRASSCQQIRPTGTRDSRGEAQASREKKSTPLPSLRLPSSTPTPCTRITRPSNPRHLDEVEEFLVRHSLGVLSEPACGGRVRLLHRLVQAGQLRHFLLLRRARGHGRPA